MAAGALFRSLGGDFVPLLTPLLLDKLGVGWGLSLFALIIVLLAPSPILFYRYVAFLREKFAIQLWFFQTQDRRNAISVPPLRSSMATAQRMASIFYI